jgi:hypothetical protein
MAVAHITFNDQLPHGRLIRRALQQLQEGREGLVDILGVLQLMIDGDSSDPSQFTYMTAKCGFPDNATAKSAWEELQSLKFKLTTDASQSNVNAAQSQAFSKFG